MKSKKMSKFKRNLLIVIAVIMVMGGVVLLLKTTTPPGKSKGPYWHRDWYKIENVDEKAHGYIKNALSTTPLPDAVVIKSFEYKYTMFLEHDLFLRIYLEIPADESLKKETMDVLSAPVSNNDDFSIKEQEEKIVAQTDSTITIEAYRFVFDKKDQLHGGTKTDYLERENERYIWAILFPVLVGGVITIIVVLHIDKKKA